MRELLPLSTCICFPAESGALLSFRVSLTYDSFLCQVQNKCCHRSFLHLGIYHVVSFVLSVLRFTGRIFYKVVITGEKIIFNNISIIQINKQIVMIFVNTYAWKINCLLSLGSLVEDQSWPLTIAVSALSTHCFTHIHDRILSVSSSSKNKPNDRVLILLPFNVTCNHYFGLYTAVHDNICCSFIRLPTIDVCHLNITWISLDNTMQEQLYFVVAAEMGYPPYRNL